jgi:anti-sigma factor RsiW
MILWGECHPSMPFSRSPRHLERLAAFIDGLLERAEQRRLAAHVRGCEACRELLDEARALLATEDASRQV